MSIAERYRPYYTYEDYCQWEGRWELIEGMPYAMSPAPIPAHQRVSVLLNFEFVKALKNCKNCKLFQPLDWKIKEDTIVQPDLLIVCEKIEKKFLDFSPVLVPGSLHKAYLQLIPNGLPIGNNLHKYNKDGILLRLT